MSSSSHINFNIFYKMEVKNLNFKNLVLKINYFGASCDYRQPSVDRLVNITSFNDVLKIASKDVSVNQYRGNSRSVQSMKHLVEFQGLSKYYFHFMSYIL